MSKFVKVAKTVESEVKPSGPKIKLRVQTFYSNIRPTNGNDDIVFFILSN